MGTGKYLYRGYAGNRGGTFPGGGGGWGIKIQCILRCHIRVSTSINWFFYLGFDEREKSVEYPEKI